MQTRAVLSAATVAVLVAGCSSWSWNPAKWSLFHRAAEPVPPPVQVLTIASASTNPGGESFVQSWDGTRLIVDIHSPNGTGRATLRPAGERWPLRLAFRMHVGALEGFEVRGAQNLRISLGPEPLAEPALIDLPYGIYLKDTPQIEIQWVDHYR